DARPPVCPHAPATGDLVDQEQAVAALIAHRLAHAGLEAAPAVTYAGAQHLAFHLHRDVDRQIRVRRGVLERVRDQLGDEQQEDLNNLLRQAETGAPGANCRARSGARFLFARHPQRKLPRGGPIGGGRVGVPDRRDIPPRRRAGRRCRVRRAERLLSGEVDMSAPIEHRRHPWITRTEAKRCVNSRGPAQQSYSRVEHVMRRTTTAASVPTPEPGYAAGAASQRDIVVIGASAGGVEALITLFAGFPAELPASVFVVLHMMPGGTSVLPKILD